MEPTPAREIVKSNKQCFSFSQKGRCQVATETKETPSQVTCRKCHATYTPSFVRDFYPDGDDPKIGQCESCMMAELFALKEPVLIQEDKLKSVCKLGGGVATCSFLCADGGGFKCAKGSSLELSIRERHEAGTMVAKGDNCQGPPDYKPIAS
jgi:hypothetical protein